VVIGGKEKEEKGKEKERARRSGKEVKNLTTGKIT
jgi:hypothetical protein